MMQYITHYEVWKEGKLAQWGNQDLSCALPPTAAQLHAAIRETVSREVHCEPEQIRILGIFKI